MVIKNRSRICLIISAAIILIAKRRSAAAEA